VVRRSGRGPAARTAAELRSGLGGAIDFFSPRAATALSKKNNLEGARASTVRQARHRPSDNECLLSFVRGKGGNETTIEIGQCWFFV
jgi:hypothetical protein